MTTKIKSAPVAVTIPAVKAVPVKATKKAKAPAQSKPANGTKKALAELRANAVEILAKIDETMKETDAEEQASLLADVENLADQIAGNANDIADGIET